MLFYSGVNIFSISFYDTQHVALKVVADFGELTYLVKPKNDAG
jgi:hypothetical protein